MKNFLRGAASAAWLLIAAACPALAQSSPNLSLHDVLTPGQWNALFAGKQDVLGYVPLNVAGGVMTGRLITAPPGAATSGFNLSPGAPPASPPDGDLWVTSSGLFAQIRGVTVGPLAGPSAASFAAFAPLNVSFPSSVVTYGLNTDSTLTVAGGKLGINLPNPNTWSGLQTFSAGVSISSAFSAPGLVKNSDLVNSSTTVNGQNCQLGGACTITASAGTITDGNTTVALGTPGRVLFDNAGVLGEYPITGTGNAVLSASPVFTGTISAVNLTLSGGLTMGATAENFPPSGAIVGTIDTQTLTNKSISGLNNSLSNIGNASLVNPSISINGLTCTLGSTCTPNAGPIVIGTTVITNGGNTKVFFDNAGVVGEYVISGTGSVAMTNAPVLVAPTLGAALGTSLALGGCTAGGNALCLSGTEAVTSASPSAFAVGANGATNPALKIDASTTAQAAGLNILGGAAGGGVALSTIDSATNSPLSLNAKGSGQISIGNASTGPVSIGAGGGGLTVANSFTAPGLVTFADMATTAIATVSNYFSGAANVLVPTSVIYQAEVAVSQVGGVLTLDFNTFLNASVTLSANITTMTLNNVKAGQSGVIRFIQPASGGPFTIVFNSIFKFAGGATPTLGAAAGESDDLFYTCISATRCDASLGGNFK
jgi:hypothetical protein